MSVLPFVHLHNHSVYSFLDGAVSPEDLVKRAAELEMPALALTDHDNLCGAVAFHKQAGKSGVKAIIGCEVTLENEGHLVLLAKNSRGYSNLCRLLTEAHFGSPRLAPRVKWASLAQYGTDLIALSGCRRGELPNLLLNGRRQEAVKAAKRYLAVFGRENFFLELEAAFLPGSQALNKALTELGRYLQIGTVATNNTHYQQKSGFILHDLLTCVRTGTKVEDVHPERRLNAENYLKTAQEMAEVFAAAPEAVKNTWRIAEACEPVTIGEDKLFPRYPVGKGETAAGMLRRLTYQGAERRYSWVTAAVRARLDYELDIICRLGYADYFLLVWDLVQFARREQIRYAGRGSAADSAVAYCLYITEVDSLGRGLLFERFMSLERAQKPDIDIDFDSRFRDKVSAYVYEKYGADKVATVCTYNTYQNRSAIRDLGKALGFSLQELGALAKKFPHYSGGKIETLLEKLPELRDSGLPLDRYRRLFELAEAVAGFPRFIGTHLGGLVVCRRPLAEVTPLQLAAKGVVVTQLDKDYIEDVGLVKLDLLSLRTMAAIEDSLGEIKAGGQALDYEQIPLDDQDTYEMLRSGRTVGVFQLESPAQRALQARLGADRLEDVVASMALIRPGPIKGNMVDPFVGRRRGLEEVTYLHPKLKPILEKTYGVVLYQEQVIEIATAIAGFTPGEADRLRRVMTHARSRREMDEIGVEFREKAVRHGISREVAETVFSYMVGYASYGFCEAHAAAFATTAYKTAYLIRHHPAEFFAALLSHQPLGYYPPNTLCVEARERGIAILPPDLQYSQDRFSVENGAIRVGLRQVKGMGEETLTAILQAREQKRFGSLTDLSQRVPLERDLLENLILCGAFDSLYANRRRLLWQLDDPWTDPPEIEDFTREEKLLQEYRVLRLFVHEHIMAYWRAKQILSGIIDSKALQKIPVGEMVTVGGLVLRPHRPPTKSGRTTVFFSLEDEFGLVDVTMFEKTYQRYGKLLFGGPRAPLAVTGKVTRRGEGASVVAVQLRPLA